MPRLKAAIKRVKTSERNRLRNLTYKTKIKTMLKKMQELVAKKDSKAAVQTANETFSIIDRATTRGIIHKNNAARKKSRISKWIKSIA